MKQLEKRSKGFSEQVPQGASFQQDPAKRSEKDRIEMFTDGSCLGNPGPGGYGVILRLRQHGKELSGGYDRTTNNRMELMAAIKGLEAIKSKAYPVEAFTDSEYLRRGIEEWLEGWKKNQWRKANRRPVLNRDLWEKLSHLLEDRRVQWHWVQAHCGHPENERCDQLAKAAAQSPSQKDEGFLGASEAG